MAERIKRIKVFGERNTGTNFIEGLLRDNLDIGVCPGILPNRLQCLYKAVSNMLPYALAWHVVEHDRNRRFEARFDEHVGWKHARLPNLPKNRDCYPDGLGFIALIKDPYAWLQSLHQRPYQGKIHSTATPLSFSDFLRTPWPTVKRECGPAEYANPVQMWNDKVASYETLHAYGPTLILPYENIIEDIEGFLKTVCHTFGLPKSGRVEIRATSTKGDDGRTTKEIVRYYRSREWVKNLAADDLNCINDQLDHGLRENFGYPRIDSQVSMRQDREACYLVGRRVPRVVDDGNRVPSQILPGSRQRQDLRQNTPDFRSN